MKTTPDISIQRSIDLNVSQARAFEVFVHQMGTWWDLDNKILGDSPGQTAIVEPHVGGRWFERDKNGVECDWGRVLKYDPNSRITLDWQISLTWQYDPNLHTEVDVAFVATSPNATRVELAHRGLERYGNQAEQMRSIFDSDNGWAGILRDYGLSVNSTTAAQ